MCNERLVGSTDITIKFTGELSEAQKEKVFISTWHQPLDGPPRYELVFQGSGEELLTLFPNNENTEISITQNIIDVTGVDHGPPREKDMSLSGQIESIIEDCEEADYIYDGEDERRVSSFDKERCLSRIKELLDGYEITPKETLPPTP